MTEAASPVICHTPMTSRMMCWICTLELGKYSEGRIPFTTRCTTGQNFDASCAAFFSAHIFAINSGQLTSCEFDLCTSGHAGGGLEYSAGEGL